jgi:NTE family protein
VESIDDKEAVMTPKRDGVGLALSGGGYRGMLFQAGVVWRLNELGWLPKLTTISCVSGGSITGGLLACAWSSLRFNHDGVAKNLHDEVIVPIRKMARTTIDIASMVRAILVPWRSSADELSRLFETRLFGTFRLADLPAEGPVFVFTATDIRTGGLWWFFRNDKLGHMSLATAVAASATLPPRLSPVVITDPDDSSGEVILGGASMYDSMGIDAIENQRATVLVSDANRRVSLVGAPRWVPQLLQVLQAPTEIGFDASELRTGELLKSYSNKTFAGTYWGIYSNLANFELADSLPAPFEQTRLLAQTPTRLARIPEVLQERLINFGYAACDASMRRWVTPSAGAPMSFPYPASGVG